MLAFTCQAVVAYGPEEDRVAEEIEQHLRHGHVAEERRVYGNADEERVGSGGCRGEKPAVFLIHTEDPGYGHEEKKTREDAQERNNGAHDEVHELFALEMGHHVSKHVRWNHHLCDETGNEDLRFPCYPALPGQNITHEADENDAHHALQGVEKYHAAPPLTSADGWRIRIIPMPCPARIGRNPCFFSV